jgi:hypothetical protein
MAETNYLTVNLSAPVVDCSALHGLTGDYLDGYDGSDSVYLDDYQKQHDDMLDEILQKQVDNYEYAQYLAEQNAKVRPANVPGDRFNRLAYHDCSQSARILNLYKDSEKWELFMTFPNANTHM